MPGIDFGSIEDDVTPLSRADLEAIIAQDLPDHELVPPASEEDFEAGADAVETSARAADADAPGVDIAQLRARFLGEDTGAVDAVQESQVPLNEHDQIVAVRPRQSSDPFDYNARPKTVVISARDRRIVGEQG